MKIRPNGKNEIVRVPAGWGGRDVGKLFKVSEATAVDAEKWAWRVLLLVGGSDARIPLDVARLGWEGIWIVGWNTIMQAQIDPDKLQPLLDDMLTCVEMVRDPANPSVATPIVADDDIEEVRTILWLRSEVVRIHTNFSPADALSALISAINSKQDSETI